MGIRDLLSGRVSGRPGWLALAGRALPDGGSRLAVSDGIWEDGKSGASARAVFPVLGRRTRDRLSETQPPAGAVEWSYVGLFLPGVCRLFPYLRGTGEERGRQRRNGRRPSGTEAPGRRQGHFPWKWLRGQASWRNAGGRAFWQPDGRHGRFFGGILL